LTEPRSYSYSSMSGNFGNLFKCYFLIVHNEESSISMEDEELKAVAMNLSLELIRRETLESTRPISESSKPREVSDISNYRRLLNL